MKSKHRFILLPDGFLHPGQQRRFLYMPQINQIMTFLGLIGVIVDPTTAGMGDSDRAMSYDEHWNDGIEN